MKRISQWTLCSLFALLMISCNDEKDVKQEASGQVTLNFDNVIGENDLVLETPSSQNFLYTNAINQTFNINLLGYYISEIKLERADGEVFTDEVSVDASASKGYYQVLESDTESQFITLEGVPAGNYTSVTFTLGVKGGTVSEGAVGGVLDPANGAWFWSWNVGYVAFMIEGASTFSGSDGDELAFHIGGWSEPNNIKEITLEFPKDLEVGDKTDSELHLHVDALKILSTLDFTATFSIHSPGAGQTLANSMVGAFEIHHVENED